MAEYSYKAVDASGNQVAGVLEANSKSSAVKNLSEQGKFVTEIIEELKSAKKKSLDSVQASKILSGIKRVKSRDVLEITSQLSAALRAGLPLVDALKIIASQQSKPVVKTMLEDITKDVSAGQSLSDTLSKQGDVFSGLYISMIKAGEAAGILDKTISQLTGLLSREEKVKTNMKNASVYPLTVLVVGLISIVIIVTFILPRVFDALGTDMDMPLPTQILLAVSDFFRHFGLLVLIALLVGWYYFNKWRKTDSGILAWDSFIIKVPILGGVIRAISVGRFARTLGSLVKGGVGILESLSVVRGTLNNELLGRAIDGVKEKVRTGHSLADPLAEVNLFPPLLVQIVSVGEHTGRLDDMLLEAADVFDEQADTAVQRFMSVFPLLLILGLAVIIFFVIIATLLPILMMTMGDGMI